MFALNKKLSYYIRIVELFVPILLPTQIIVIIADQQLRGSRSAITQCSPLDLRCWLPTVLQFVRDLLPGLVTLGVLGFLSADFVKAVYGLETRSQGFDFVKRLLFGIPEFTPFLRIAGGKLEADDKNPLVRTGGPCGLVVYNDSAAVLEKAGRLTRVVKPGFPKLEPFEKVWDVIDLRPRRWVYDVSAMSKDGIPVTCQADVTFQIDDGGQAPSQDAPFPATEQAIFLAATRKLIREASRSEDDQKMDWAGRAIVGTTEGTLRTILATYLLDQFLGSDEVNRSHYRSQIRSRLEVELRKSFPDIGVKLIKVELGDIKVPDVANVLDGAGEPQMKTTAQIFLSYARVDKEQIEKLYQQLLGAGFQPWMDKDILPGEDWESSIQQAIRRSDFFLACLSSNSIGKRGFLQKEIRVALEILQEQLDSDIYLIPVRLENCEVPESLRKVQWVDLFEKDGWTRLVKAIQAGMERRAGTVKPTQEPMPPEPHRAHEEPHGKAMPEVDSKRLWLTRLCKNLSAYFSAGELHMLCFNLGVDYDDLPGQGKTDKARDLVSLLDRRDRIPELVKICSEQRPNVSWDDKSETN